MSSALLGSMLPGSQAISRDGTAQCSTSGRPFAGARLPCRHEGRRCVQPRTLLPQGPTLRLYAHSCSSGHCVPRAAGSFAEGTVAIPRTCSCRHGLLSISMPVCSCHRRSGRQQAPPMAVAQPESEMPRRQRSRFAQGPAPRSLSPQMPLAAERGPQPPSAAVAEPPPNNVSREAGSRLT